MLGELGDFASDVSAYPRAPWFSRPREGATTIHRLFAKASGPDGVWRGVFCRWPGRIFVSREWKGILWKGGFLGFDNAATDLMVSFKRSSGIVERK